MRISHDSAQAILHHYIKLELIKENLTHEISINIFANQIRREIYNTIESNPGITINKLKQFLDIGSHQILYHLGALLEFNQIQFVQFNKIKSFGIKSISKEHIIIGFYLLRTNVCRIISHILNSNALFTITRLSDALEDLPESTVRYCIKNLVNVKFLHIDLINDERVYVIKGNHQDIAKQLLMNKNG
ncbi:MAG: hypothetical protein ACTSRK_10995, partial [Promethearchaeota archaeon]